MKALVLPFGLCVALLAAATLRADEPEKPAGERFALLVGVQKYNDPTELKPLQYAEDDVTVLAKVLEEAGYKKQNIMLMTQKRGGEEGRAMPESAKIRQEMELLLKGRKKEDVVLLAFTGHGVQFEGSEENFFCPMDTKLADKKTLISMQELYGELEKCEAGLKVLLVDACRDDPRPANARSRDVVDLDSVTRPPKEPPSGGVAAFFSCSAGQRAFEDAELKHGVFFYHVIQGLRGSAARAGTSDVFLGDLEYFVNSEVEPFVRRKMAQKQQPQLFTKLTGKQPPLVSWPKAAEPPTTTKNGKEGGRSSDDVGPTDRVNLPGYSSKDHKLKRVIALRQMTNHRQTEAPKHAPDMIAISADGSKMAWFAPASGLWTANFDGSGIKQVYEYTRDKRRPQANRLVMSPDGQHVFWQDHGGPIHRVNTDGQDPRILVQEGAEYTNLKLRRWGNRIYYGSRWGIYSVDTEGVGDIQKILTHEDLLKVFNIPNLQFQEFDVSERGTEMALSIYDPDLKRRQLYRFTVGSDPVEDLQPVLETSFEPNRISISPDGSRIFYSQYGGSSYLVNWDGTGQRELKIPGQNANVSVQFSPDGRWITYPGDYLGSIIVNIDTTEMIDVVQAGRWDGANLAILHSPSPVAMSRDLRRFLYVMNFGGGPMPPQLVTGEINPPKLEGLPTLSDIAFPKSFSFRGEAPNYTGEVSVKVAKGKKEVDRVQFILTPTSQFRDGYKQWNPEAGWFGLRCDHVLKDDGMNGDAKGGDGIWTIGKAGMPHVDSMDPGKFQMRFIAQEKTTSRAFEKVNAVIVDVDGLEVVK